LQSVSVLGLTVTCLWLCYTVKKHEREIAGLRWRVKNLEPPDVPNCRCIVLATTTADEDQQ
jgi:hypothetical protein